MQINFIGIGSQRCGKTTIYNWMEQHPQISTSSEMELNFFNNHYDHGYNWYERKFLKKKRTLMSGEMSSSYIYDLSVPKKVFEYSNDMKIILSVRNPIDRLISAYRHDIQIGNIILDGEYSIKKGIKNNPTYLEYGLYAKYLKEWLKVFPKENISVIIFEEMIKRPHESYLNLCEFLKIDNSFRPQSINKKYNSSWLPKNQRLVSIQKNIAKIFRNVGLGKLVDGLKIIGLKKTMDKINSDRKSKIVDMDDDFKSYLFDYFKEDVEELSKLVKVDLKKLWLQ
jgi:hypothetical protein